MTARPLAGLSQPAVLPPLPLPLVAWCSLPVCVCPAAKPATMEPTDMDDDVDIKIPNREGGPLVFGTIQRGDAAAAVAAGEAAGNIFRQTADAEVLELPEVRS